MSPGSIVRCRNRDWVLLPSDDPDLVRLRPLTGTADQITTVLRSLADFSSVAEERIGPSRFPPVRDDQVLDAASAHLLWQAARLSLREGASPLRSLGRIGIRPRIYQFVPLLMALRLEKVRMLIADDVGVGKTVEALLIARELLDRGEIRSFVVVCPPALCDQWQSEMREKFNLDAVVLRSGTARRLEAPGESVYNRYPVLVASIDFLKTHGNKWRFIQDCPDLVIVDEAHGSADGGAAGRHHRHELLKAVAQLPGRHLLLLTATPHSGVESAFKSLIGLLDPEFSDYTMGELDEERRKRLARHFVQRTRDDIKREWGEEHSFPTRDSQDRTYPLSGDYRTLFDRTFAFCSELVEAGQGLGRRQQRVRYWAALGLLRCVMSSPAAAVAALRPKPRASTSEEQAEFGEYIFEDTEELVTDDLPLPPIEEAEAEFEEPERRRLGELAKLAQGLGNSAKDTKLATCLELVRELLHQGHHPILWCRYVATAEYLGKAIAKELRRMSLDVGLGVVTGRIDDEERRAKVHELMSAPRRVLVATDCLSEGINLQAGFTATVHYDLPWNPNRLEQREGRVDRYGQRPDLVVPAVRLFSPENPVDGVVVDVLLNKAREIHRALGTHVPVPEESESVTQAVLNALFLRRGSASLQPTLDFGGDVGRLHADWDRKAARERENRNLTRFAQRALRPDAVREELEKTDDVLGDPCAVQEFVLNAAQRLGMGLTPSDEASVYIVDVDPNALGGLPVAVRALLPRRRDGRWKITFDSPSPAGAEYVGRNGPFVAGLAGFLMEQALLGGADSVAARAGAIATRAVTERTFLALVRVRYLVEVPERPSLLSEEVVALGWGADGEPLASDTALSLMAKAKPDQNLAAEMKRELVRLGLEAWAQLSIDPVLRDRAAELETSHRRIRDAVRLRVRELKVRPQTPPDLLGILVLEPVA